MSGVRFWPQQSESRGGDSPRITKIYNQPLMKGVAGIPDSAFRVSGIINSNGGHIMLNQNQDTKRQNTTETVVPSEASQESGSALPIAMPTSPMDYPVERFSQALERREDNRKALLKWIQSNLQAGIDFGQIHVVGKNKCRLAGDGRAHECIEPRHWSKPSLWKPGAEKICGMLGLIPRFPNLSEYEKAVLRGEDIKVIILKCELHTGSGFVAAEGTGARRVAQDSGNINTSLKMAEKSAHIDATLRVAGLSELFTQDLEDMTIGAKQDIQPDTGRQTPPNQHHSQKKASSPPPRRHTGGNGGNGDTRKNAAAGRTNQHPANGQGNGGNRISGKQYKFIMDLMKEAGMTKRELNDHCMEAYGSVVDHISRADASSLINWYQD
jgi:hypothetical protein